jgi:Flp pilus assembly protein TadD
VAGNGPDWRARLEDLSNRAVRATLQLVTEAFGFLGATLIGLIALVMAMRAVAGPSPTVLGVDHGIKLVEDYLAAGRLMEAMVVSKKLARVAPRSLRVRLVVVDVMCARERHEDALEELRQLALERPNNSEVEAKIAALTEYRQR